MYGVEATKWLFHGGAVVVSRACGDMKGKFRIDPSSNPPRIDINWEKPAKEDPPTAPFFDKGVYSLEAGRLLMHWKQLSDYAKRPSDFKIENSPDAIYVELVRVSK